MTHDVDIVVALALRDVQRFIEAFPLDEFYCPPEDVLAIEVRRGQRGHCNLIHHGSGFKADIYIAFDELHRWALAHRSKKHVRDIRGMLEVSSVRIDRPLLEQWIARLGLTAEWARVLAEV